VNMKMQTTCEEAVAAYREMMTGEAYQTFCIIRDTQQLNKENSEGIGAVQ